MSDNREVRNEIFSTGAQQPMPAANQPGYDVPVESVPLPSSGKTYPEGTPLHKCTTVDIRSMTAREEDILTSRALIKNGTVISELLKSCIMNKGIDVRSMLSGDRNAVMIALRITGYGPEYSAKIECPSCSEESKQDFDLTELPIKRLSITPVREGENIFEYVLPVSKKVVHFKFLTGRDEEEMSTSTERMRKKAGAQVESLVTTRLNYGIVAIDGKTDKGAILTFIRNMPARDSLMLRRYMEEHEPGIDMKGWINCPHCGHNEEVQMPMGPSFFWPDA